MTVSIMRPAKMDRGDGGRWLLADRAPALRTTRQRISTLERCIEIMKKRKAPTGNLQRVLSDLRTVTDG